MRQTFDIVSNCSLELLSPSGEVLEKDEFHNLVVNSGIDWMTRRIWAGVTGIEFDPIQMPVTDFAIILGDGNGGVYIPVAGDNSMRGSSVARIYQAPALTRPRSLAYSIDEATKQVTFQGSISADDVTFHVREMGLGATGNSIASLGRSGAAAAQTVDAVDYLMLNLASNPPNRDYSGVTGTTIRATVAFRLVASS